MVDFEGLAQLPGAWNQLTFRALRAAVFGWLRVYNRYTVEGAPPPGGGYVLAANHSSFLDPLVLGSACRPRVTFLMTETVWRSHTLGWFYRWMRTIPLSARGGNRDALRAARSVLQQGRVIGIFPEGGISRDGLPMLGSPGAVSLVLNEGRPIVPVGIVGAFDALPSGRALPRPRRITVRFGAPIPPDELAALGTDRRTRLREATALIMRRIAALTGATAREDVLASAPAS
ncbi:MAG: 1-acyl-sn-glycerol-3-phosphate acyltransferase [Planctomycetes bacterium]|nr:1-acyl-sn-glycerol-3-phosphate acyltransferase [Planctomycetota bacterium]